MKTTPSSHLVFSFFILTSLAIAHSSPYSSSLENHVGSEENSNLFRSLDSSESPQPIKEESEDEPGIQTNTELNSPEMIMRRLIRPFVLLPRTSNPKFPPSRWYFPGFGYFSRGGRAGNSNFIRFGRARGGGSTGPTVASGYASKKNNFIRLGRAGGHGRNNFIRLGRSSDFSSKSPVIAYGKSDPGSLYYMGEGQ